MSSADPTLSNSIQVWRRLNKRLTVFSLLFLAFCATAWQLFVPSKWVAISFWTAFFLVPGHFMHEFWRRVLIQTGKVKHCAFGALLYLILIGLFILFLQAHSITPVACAIVISASALFSSIFMSKQFKKIPFAVPDSLTLPAGIGRFGKWAILSHLAYSLYNTGIQLALSLISGASAMGGFSAIRNVIQPVNIVIGAIDSVDKPRAARAYALTGFAGLFTSIRGTLSLLILIGGAYLLICGVTGGFILGILYEKKYGAPWQEVWLWCVVGVAMLLAQPLESALYVANRPDGLFLNRVISALFGLSAAFALIPKMGVKGAIMGLAIGWLTTAILAVAQLRFYAMRSLQIGKN